MTSNPEPQIPASLLGTTPSRRRLGVFVLVDGLGYELVRESDFLPDFELRVGLRSVLGPVEAAHASLLSGRSVGAHAITARWLPTEPKAPAGIRPWWSWLPSFLAETGWVRERARRALVAPTDVELQLPSCPLRLMTRFAPRFAGGLFTDLDIGPVPSIFERLAHQGVRISVHPGDVPEALAFDMAAEQVRDGGCELLFLRLPRLGKHLRRHGTVHQEVRDQLDQLAGGLRRLQQLAESHVEEVEFFVFGDQAAIDTHGYVDLAAKVEQAFGRNGDRVLAFYHETQARFWSRDAATQREIEDHLGRSGQGRVVPDEELLALGWPSLAAQRGSLFVLDPGLAIFPNYVESTRPIATSGYHPELPHTLAALLGSFSPSLDVTEVRGIFDLIEDTAGRILQDRA